MKNRRGWIAGGWIAARCCMRLFLDLFSLFCVWSKVSKSKRPCHESDGWSLVLVYGKHGVPTTLPFEDCYWMFHIKKSSPFGKHEKTPQVWC